MACPIQADDAGRSAIINLLKPDACRSVRAPRRHVIVAKYAFIGLLLAATARGSALAAQAEPPADLFTDNRDSQTLIVQVLLDRAHQSPGVIDASMGANTRRAIRAYQTAAGEPVTGQIDEQLLASLNQEAGAPILQRYTIAKEDVDGPFRDIPSNMTAKAALDKSAYGSPAEALAEKFHMAETFLKALNPRADFGLEGTTIVVVGPGEDKLRGSVARIDVDKEAHEVRAYSAEGTLVATYPTTVGNSVHPSPSEATLHVTSVAPKPTYYFDPDGRDWGPDHKLTIAPGPNNPVGVVWIDLSRAGYGIHGTPDPDLIGKTSSHGCVRLTNWDAKELSQAVSKGTTVQFN